LTKKGENCSNHVGGCAVYG
ncbi:hypothetical protein CFOL_v3_29065, partial [Cephalotus follicularis]